jgi:hypothetical protein
LVTLRVLVFERLLWFVLASASALVRRQRGSDRERERERVGEWESERVGKRESEREGEWKRGRENGGM